MAGQPRPTWWKQPGEVVDSRGVPIHPGDLLRSPHFTDRRGRKHYLWHVAVFVNGYMEMVPTCHLQPDRVKGGGRCMLSEAMSKNLRVMSGSGPEPYLDHEDRPKVRIPAGKPARLPEVHGAEL